jgi:hypothetical protein
MESHQQKKIEEVFTGANDMTYSDFNDAGAHLSKPAWNHARKLLHMGFPPQAAINEAEIYDRALTNGANTKKVIYEKKSA